MYIFNTEYTYYDKKRKEASMEKRAIALLCVLSLSLSLTGCTSQRQDAANTKQQETESGKSMNSYERISQEAAKNLMESDQAGVILDVRTQEEYAQGHIEDAICIPVETITDKEPVQLKDKEQLILVYCRSGNRSRQAANKLAQMGYTNVKEFGGINTWSYDLVK